MRRIFDATSLFVATACLVAGFAIATQPSTALAQAESLDRAAWIGVKVMPKLNAQVKADSGVIDEKKLYLPLVVQDLKDDLLLVGDHDKGWVKRSEVMRPREAPAYYTSLIVRGEHLAWAYEQRAITWAVIGMPELCLADFEEVLRLEPNARAYSWRGAVRVLTKDYDDAIDDITQAIGLDPNDAAAYGSRGDAWSYKKQYDKAIADFDKAIGLDPNDATAYDGRGRAWLGKQDYDKAIADCNQAIRLDPSDTGFYVNRAAVWSRKKQYDKMLADINQSVGLRGGCRFGLPKSSPPIMNR